MPRLIAVVLLLLFCASSTQLATAQQTRFSISATADLSWFELEMPLPGWEDGRRISPGIWLGAQIPLSFIGGPLAERLALETGVRYSQQATQVDWVNTIGVPAVTYRGYFQIRQHYALIPILFHVPIGQSPFSLVAGPEVGLLVAGVKVSETEAPVEAQSFDKRSVADDIKSFHAALNGGIQARLNDRFVLFVMYSGGLGKHKQSPEASVLVSDWEVREVVAGIRYVLPVKGQN